MPLDPVLRSLLTAQGPSGYEGAATAAWLAAAKAFAEVRKDPMGSGVARVPGTGEGPTVAVMGHIDEIGLLVTHVDDDGFVRFRPIGSWDPQVLVSQRVDVIAGNSVVPGVIGKKPIHLAREEKRTDPLELRDLHIDLGAASREEAAALVEPGDVAVIAGEPLELRNDRVAARAMDNRLGCYVALEAARLVHEAGGAAGDVVAVAAVQEENSKVGAQVHAYELCPDVAIVVDVAHETSAPDIDVRQLGAHRFGSGPIVARGSILHAEVIGELRASAEAEEIAYTLAGVGTPTQTDADAVHCVRAGIATAVISLPLRYMHSSVELIDLGDVAAAARLIAAFCLRLTPETRFSR